MSTIVVEPSAIVIEDVLPGRVVPLRVAEVRPQVGGIVRERLFREGDAVTAGQPLYRIDSSVFRAELAGASASVARQEAAVSLAAREAERARQLASTGAGTTQGADNAESTRALAEADLALSRATVRRSRLQLQYSVVTAPIAGRIGISRVTEGALVGPMDPTSLATIQQIDEVYVDIRQPAARYEELREAFGRGDLLENEAVPVTLVSLQGRPYEAQGRLLFTDISVDPSTSELTLRVIVPNADTRLLPGMFVRARLAFGRDPDAIAVPQQAIRHDPSLGATVLIVDRGDVVAVRSVRVGRVVDGRQIVLEGLAAGDRVIVEGMDMLGPGMPVRPTPWTLPTPETAHTETPAPPGDDATPDDDEG
ncbi:MAG: efflux RND transporter periplasmic adaptor subunit [Deltaproteobacteria bacterium]|nr:efflux RND transporter periplasmic adaptor subunit [Deltaproteobacteria bacterium]